MTRGWERPGEGSSRESGRWIAKVVEAEDVSVVIAGGSCQNNKTDL